MHFCLFDIDGTLMDTGGAGQAAMEAALEIEFNATKPIEGISTAGRTDRAITSDMFAYHGIEDHPENWERFQTTYFRQLPLALTTCDGIVFPGIRELLDQLVAREDVVLALLTGNYRQGADTKLAHYELDHHFAFGGFGDVHHHRDDVAREALIGVRRRHGEVDLDRVWVIGDTPADVTCARAINAKVVAVGTGLHPNEEVTAAEPDHFFEDLADTQVFIDLLD
jgi:phosphoglycolate phosphatase-like HAD superfamily hydrolase